MLTQNQLTTKEQFKAHFDAMLIDKVSGEFIFEHKGYNYVLANADKINKIIYMNIWGNEHDIDDFFLNKRGKYSKTSELAWEHFDEGYELVDVHIS